MNPSPANAAVTVETEGLEGTALANVRSSLSLLRQAEDPDLSDRRVRSLHAQAEREIRLALQPLGFYRAVIQADLIRTDDGWHARYVVDRGPPLRVTQAELRVDGAGAGDPELQALVAEFPLQRGKVLEHATYEDAKRRWLRTAVERGYLDAAFTKQEIRIDLEAYAAAIALHLDTGPRYRFGPVTFQQDVLDPAFLNRYVPFKPGDPYSATALLELQTGLADSDYFASVEVRPQRELEQDLAVPIEVILTPRPVDKYTFGVGYGTDTGVRGSLGWERRRVNARGHHVRSDLQASEIRTTLSASYVIPTRDPRTDQIAFTAGTTDEETRTSESRIRTLSVSHSRSRGPWRQSLSVSWQKESFEIAGDADDSTLVMPGAGWTRIWAEDRIFTRRGGRFAIDFRGGSETLGSDTSFLQMRSQAKLIRPLGESGRVILRADTGATRIREFVELPASVRFFAGGDQSVRGYAYNTLGPTDATGAVVGGKHLLVGSVEYEHRLGEKWAAATFYDAGNAIDELSESLKKGAGFGVRWRSPVGQIRVDFARALSDPARPWRMHLTIGPDL